MVVPMIEDNGPSDFSEDEADYRYGIANQKQLDTRELTGRWVIKTDGTRAWSVKMEDDYARADN